MNKVYEAVADCRKKFVEMSYAFTIDVNEIEEAVQELMIYFLQMNPETLKSIYEKDGKTGLIRYGAVALRRSFTSTRSPYYYKYKKYYTHIDSSIYSSTVDGYDDFVIPDGCHYKDISNLPNEEVDNQHILLEKIDSELDKLYWYDRDIFKLYYYEGNSLTGLSKKTGISRNSLFTTIDKVRKIVKELVDE